MGLAIDEGPFLARLRVREITAFEELVRRETGRLLAVTRRILRSEEDAQDAVQEAFLHAYEALPSFRGEARLSTWLHRIVVNSALMKLRSRRRHPEDPIDELLPRFKEDGHRLEPGPAWMLPADQYMERKELMVQVRACIDRLPESYRTILVLGHVEGLDTKEIAQALGLTPEAVKMRLHRARQALRTLLDPQLREAVR